MEREVNIWMAVGHSGMVCAISDGLDRINGVRLTGSAASMSELKALLEAGKPQPDVLLIDAELDASSGFVATRRMAEEFPGIEIVALAESGDWIYIRKMIASGASGYILKESWYDGLMHWLEEYRPKQEIRVSMHYVSSEKSTAPTDLDQKERQVLRLMINHHSMQEIGRELSMGRLELEHTIDRLSQKTRSKNPIDLKRYAIRHAIY